MEVDTNELLHRIGAVLRGISDKMDRLIEAASDHFADASKMVAEKPAKEPVPEHPAGPKPDPGEGYRILSKDPPEELRDGDEFFHCTLGEWCESIHAGWGYKMQDTDCWYRRKIETPKDEYREPVLPADCCKQCEFSDDGNDWTDGRLSGYAGHLWQSISSEVVGAQHWVHARIKKDA